MSYDRKKNTVMLFDSSQIAYPIGKDRHSFSLCIWVTVDAITGAIVEVKAQAVRDWVSTSRNLVIHEGTIGDCLEAINMAIYDIQGREEVEATKEQVTGF